MRSVVAFRSTDDELAVMTNAEMTARVIRIGRCAVGRTLSPRERRRLRRLAQSARPCEITRVLYQWRGTLTDRLVRTVQRREDILRHDLGLSARAMFPPAFLYIVSLQRIFVERDRDVRWPGLPPDH